MFDLGIYLTGLAAIALFAILGWIASVYKNNVTLVDTLWGLFFVLATAVYLTQAPETGSRARILFVFVTGWALRLSCHLGRRNRGASEDRRYQAIRNLNEPHFRFKSLYLIFGSQTLLAWIVSLPLLGIALSQKPWGWLDAVGFMIGLFGLAWESIADWQLQEFKSDPNHRNAVMRAGLWRYSRHPNYFGECCLWWGIYGMALSSGAWWSLPGPVLMTWLLLKVTGVALLERDIGLRRLAYADYMHRTPAFFPWKPKRNDRNETH